MGAVRGVVPLVRPPPSTMCTSGLMPGRAFSSPIHFSRCYVRASALPPITSAAEVFGRLYFLDCDDVMAVEGVVPPVRPPLDTPRSSGLKPGCACRKLTAPPAFRGGRRLRIRRLVRPHLVCTTSTSLPFRPKWRGRERFSGANAAAEVVNCLVLAALLSPALCNKVTISFQRPCKSLIYS